MKVSSRITAPVVLALLCAGVLIVFLWWQIARSTVVLRPDSPVVIPPDDFLNEPTITAPPQAIDPRDQALVHLRQGDLSALKGDWKGAQKEYKLSVEANGGLPALRKLATAQLQRRDIADSDRVAMGHALGKLEEERSEYPRAFAAFAAANALQQRLTPWRLAPFADFVVVWNRGVSYGLFQQESVLVSIAYTTGRRTLEFVGAGERVASCASPVSRLPGRLHPVLLRQRAAA